MNKFTALDRKHQRDLKSQEMYVGELPVEELMMWPKSRINPFNTLDAMKLLMSQSAKHDSFRMGRWLNMREFPDFTGEYDAGWINHQMREFQKNKKNLEAIKEKKRQEKLEIDNYYKRETDGIEQEQELIKQDMARYLNQYGMISVSTSMGNVHITTMGDKLNWKDLNASEKRAVATQLPDDLVNRTPKASAVMKAVAIQPDGTVVLKETGEILKGITGQQGGTKTVVFRKG